MNLNKIIARSSDPAVNVRLDQCIKKIAEAADSWEEQARPQAELMLAVASPKAGKIVVLNGWPVLPEGDYTFEFDDMVRGLVDTIEAPPSDANTRLIAATVEVLLGLEGCTAFLADAKAIYERNELPILLFMIADVSTIVATSVSIPPRTLN